MKRRFLILLVTLSLLISLVPSTVFAEETSDGTLEGAGVESSAEEAEQLTDEEITDSGVVDSSADSSELDKNHEEETEVPAEDAENMVEGTGVSVEDADNSIGEAEDSEESLEIPGLPDEQSAVEMDEQGVSEAKASTLRLSGLKAVPAGKNKVRLTWNPVSSADGYLIYGLTDGPDGVPVKKYGFIGLAEGTTTFTDTNASAELYNFYWVFPYVKNSSGKMIPGSCERYVYAKGICPAVTNLKASSVPGGVKLTWTGCQDADGYLIYGLTDGGDGVPVKPYGYIGMTGKETTFTDKNASKTLYNYYWVYPYFKNTSGKMIPGLTGKYVYGKALEPITKPGNVTGLKAAPAGKNKVKLSWNPVSGADGYLIYGLIDGPDNVPVKAYGFLGTTTKETVFTDTAASEINFNFYWVFAYVKDSSGKMIPGGCQKYVFAKGICPPVTNLKASSGIYGVTLTWNASPGAEGYLIYGQTDSSEYGFKGATKSTTWEDVKAPRDEYTYYWVCPYFTNESGNMIPGQCISYAFGITVAGSLYEYAGCSEEIEWIIAKQVLCSYYYIQGNQTKFKENIGTTDGSYLLNEEGDFCVSDWYIENGHSYGTDIPIGVTTYRYTSVFSDFLNKTYVTAYQSRTDSGNIYNVIHQYKFNSDGTVNMKMGLYASDVIDWYDGTYSVNGNKLTVHLSTLTYYADMKGGAIVEPIDVTIQYDLKCFKNHLLLIQTSGRSVWFDDAGTVLYLSQDTRY